MIKKIFLDPGHGGNNIGSSGYGLVEKEINLSLALRLRRKLEAYDCEIIMSRTSDTTVSLAQRATMANNNNVDFFFSLHSNGFSDSSVGGYEDFIHSSPSRDSIDYQNIIHSHISCVWVTAGRPNRGKKRANFYVLRETRMPALLVENGFLTNSRDASLLKDEGFLEKLVDAMMTGIVEALNLPRKTTAPVPPQEIYRVQAGAFSTRERAENQVRRLRDAGFDAFIQNLDAICPSRAEVNSIKKQLTTLSAELEKQDKKDMGEEE